jgi:hypothetical protein
MQTIIPQSRAAMRLPASRRPASKRPGALFTPGRRRVRRALQTPCSANSGVLNWLPSSTLLNPFAEVITLKGRVVVDIYYYQPGTAVRLAADWC